MKVTACLLLLASTAMAKPREAKAFSLFSVVTFPNDECTTVMDPTMRGLCITAEECTDQGGTASGNCASGFGVCCFTTVTEQGAITNNVTYIQNEGFPTAVLGTGVVAAATLMFTVEGGANICQVRFDFESATVFEQPVLGVCGGDQDEITVGQTSTTIGSFTNLCGTLTGQHIYVENDGANPAATLTIATSDTVLARTWKILVRTIECDSPAKAPGGCLQYFTGTSGNIVSFNAGTTGALIDNLLYSICLRKEAGMCSYTVREARSGTGATPDAFTVGTDTTAGVGLANCAAAHIVIPNSAVLAPEYCGVVLSNTNDDTVSSVVTGNGAQFQIRVVTTAANTGVAGTGFDLIYSQVGCS